MRRAARRTLEALLPRCGLRLQQPDFTFAQDGAGTRTSRCSAASAIGRRRNLDPISQLTQTAQSRTTIVRATLGGNSLLGHEFDVTSFLYRTIGWKSAYRQVLQTVCGSQPFCTGRPWSDYAQLRSSGLAPPKKEPSLASTRNGTHKLFGESQPSPTTNLPSFVTFRNPSQESDGVCQRRPLTP